MAGVRTATGVISHPLQRLHNLEMTGMGSSQPALGPNGDGETSGSSMVPEVEVADSNPSTLLSDLVDAILSDKSDGSSTPSAIASIPGGATVNPLNPLCPPPNPPPLQTSRVGRLVKPPSHLDL